MALVDLKSNLANFRSNFVTPGVEKKNAPEASTLNIDTIPAAYSGKTKFTKSFIDKSSFDRADQFILKYTGRTRFTSKYVNTSKFNIDSTPTKFSPNAKYDPTKLYPESIIPKTITRWAGNQPPAVNFIDDVKSNAKGFTVNLGKSGAYEKSQFISFDYTKSLPTKNSKFDQGNVSLTNQLGKGSPFPDSLYYNDGRPATGPTYSWLPKEHTGFYSGNTYSTAAGKVGFLAPTYNSNSPIDELYKKYNLQDAANSETSTGPNSSYIRQPFIERGIQRKGKESPQRWGIGNFDDGLIRGGITTAIERAAVDAARIGKWMASPRGLLWIVKQIGLGLTNPKVEAPGGPLTRQTRIHTGVTSLLSVAGNAFGLHFTRHGIPFKNETASYEKVIKDKPVGYSRLIELRKEFDAGTTYTNKLLSNVKILATKSFGSAILSGLGGSASVYGIGFTQIRRVVDTTTNSNIGAVESGFQQKDFLGKSYVSELRAKTNNVRDSKVSGDDGNRGREDYLRGRFENLKGQTYTPGASTSIRDVERTIQSYKDKIVTYPPIDTQNQDINNYITLAYNKIPKSTDIRKFNDFRENIKNDSKAQISEQEKGLLGARDSNYYESNNLAKKYGLGDLGAVNVDRTNPNEFIVKADLTLGTPKNRTLLSSNTKFRGDKITAINVVNSNVNDPGTLITKGDVYPDGASDLIKFYFEDGTEGINVMPFRCTMTGFTDNFSPGWDKVDIMGRPDGAYLYSSFERSISFNFIVAALSRSEMIPMWRKLNRLASYTMPDFDGIGGRASGPFMRITIGNLFQQTPGFITSLSYTIPDDATWDIAEDFSATNPYPKQLPMMVEASINFTIVGDYRPQLKGRVYSLQPINGKVGSNGDWIQDAKQTEPEPESAGSTATVSAV